jgi:hypothetical protein
MARVEEQANLLPTPPAQYGPGAASRSHSVSDSDSSAAERPPRYQGARPRRQGPKPIPVGARCTNSIQLPASVEAVEPDERPPLAPLQQIHERTRIINPLKQRREEPDTGREGVGKRRSTTREERLQALDFEDNAREWQTNKKGEMVLKKPSRRRVAAVMGFDEAQLRQWRQAEKIILDAPSSSCSGAHWESAILLSHTGDGLVQEDNWPRLLRLLDEKGALATAKEAQEHEEDDEFTAV